MDDAAPAAVQDFRALVVDDEAPLADVVASYLKRESFEVHLAHDGRGALTLAREVDPDVVILDIGLPGVDGIEVCRQLRAFSDAYVIMLTARDTEPAQRRLIDARAPDVTGQHDADCNRARKGRDRGEDP